MNDRVVRFGPHAALCGVVSRPAVLEADAPGILLLTAAMEHRVGPNRFYVKLARALAENGFPVLRFDFSGVGDSGSRRDGMPFQRSAIEETQAAMDVLAAETGCRSFVLAGICMGATISFRVACVDTRIVGVTLINAPQYLDDHGPDVMRTIWRLNQIDHYRQVKIFDWRSWRKLLSGRSHYATLLGAGLAKLRAAQMLKNLRSDAGGDAAAFERLRGRGVGLLLVFAERDTGLEYLRLLLGRQVQEWRKDVNPRVEVIGGTDHMLTRLESQQYVQRLMLEWGSTRFLPRSAGADPAVVAGPQR